MLPGEFAENLSVIKRYLVQQKLERSSRESEGEQKRLRNLEEATTRCQFIVLEGAALLIGLSCSAFETGTLQALFDHVNHLSDFATPQILSVVKEAMLDWRKGDFNVVQSVQDT